MRKLLLALIALFYYSSIIADTLPILNSNTSYITIKEEGKEPHQWISWPSKKRDIYKTSSKIVTFVSDIDSITFDMSKQDSYDFTVLIKGKEAPTGIQYKSLFPFDEVPKHLLNISKTGKLSKEQACFDIDAMIYTISEIHPNMFNTYNEGAYFEQIAKIKHSLPDSLSIKEFYKYVAPLASMIDGHTTMSRRSLDNDPNTLRMPFTVNIDLNDSTITLIKCIDKKIPSGATILSINGKNSKSIIESMMPYASGERYFFKLLRINDMFSFLYTILYPSDSYSVTYSYKGKEKGLIMKPATMADINKGQEHKKKSAQKTPYYTYRIENGIAIMDFNDCIDVDRMQIFADSMFTELKAKNIKNLIIDIRTNGGGTSDVGDELLQYISKVPFQQFGKAIMRFTPTSMKLLGESNNQTGWYYSDKAKLINLRDNPQRYDGNVYLLTSHNTFSAAASFSWAFKKFNAGTIVGEETGGMNVCYGDNLQYTLPITKIKCYISFKRFWQYDADETNIHGTIPDIKIPANNALNYTIELIKYNSEH